jgi:hypothetical protein
MAQVLLFNGALNTLVLGFPGYIWALFVLGILLVFTNAFHWLLFWNPLKALHGLWLATWGKTDAALIIDFDNYMTLVSEAKAKLIFENADIKEAKKNEDGWKSTVSGQMGTIGTDIIIDLGKWTNPSTEERYLIQECADTWNLQHPDDQILSFGKFMKYCEDGYIECAIPTFVNIDWLRIESAFPKQRNTALYAGYIRQLSEKMDKLEKSKLDNVAIYILIVAGIVSVLMVVGKFFMK